MFEVLLHYCMYHIIIRFVNQIEVTQLVGIQTKISNWKTNMSGNVEGFM